MTRVCNDPEDELPNVVRVAAQAALLLIEKYYTLMSECDLYIIAIGMYFCHSLFQVLTIQSYLGVWATKWHERVLTDSVKSLGSHNHGL